MIILGSLVPLKALRFVFVLLSLYKTLRRRWLRVPDWHVLARLVNTVCIVSTRLRLLGVKGNGRGHRRAKRRPLHPSDYPYDLLRRRLQGKRDLRRQRSHLVLPPVSTFGNRLFPFLV